MLPFSFSPIHISSIQLMKNEKENIDEFTIETINCRINNRSIFSNKKKKRKEK